jgi:hypothetical protein
LHVCLDLVEFNIQFYDKNQKEAKELHRFNAFENNLLKIQSNASLNHDQQLNISKKQLKIDNPTQGHYLQLNIT